MGMRRSMRAERKSVLARQEVTRQQRTPAREGLGRDLAGVLFFAASTVAMLGLLTFDAGRPAVNLIGPLGHTVASRLLGTLGVCGFLVPLVLLCVAVGLFVRAPARRRGRQMLGLAALAAFGAALAHLALGASAVTPWPPGGAVGRFLGESMRGGLSTVGSVIAASTAVLCALIVVTNAAVVSVAVAVARLAGWVGRTAGIVLRTWAEEAAQAFAAWREERAREIADAEALAAAGSAGSAQADEEPDADQDELEAEEAEAVAEEADRLARESQALRRIPDEEPAPFPEPDFRPRFRPGRQAPERDPAWAEPEPVEIPPVLRARTPLVIGPPAPRQPPPPPPEAFLEVAPPQILEDLADDEAPTEIVEAATEAPAAIAAETAAPAERAEPRTPTIVEPKQLPRPTARDPYAFAEGQTFSLPSVDLLEDAPTRHASIDEKAYLVIAQKLTAKLADHGIEGAVVEIRPGPVITMYEFAPGPGIKISKIVSLADDLAMAMEALRVRIVAPIPGKAVVGIEVPNREPQTVYLREILEQDAFAKSASKLTMVLGKDIQGMPYITDLAKMPHLLIAGTTGSGKSVALNAMVMSLLLKSTPEDVRFLMVDPKKLELSLYDGIPHLLLPVVTDPRKAALALRWAVEEMERRYQMLADAGVRNIAGFNKWIERGRSGPHPVVITPRRPRKTLVVDVAEGESEEEALARAQEAEVPEAAADPEAPRRLPYVVIVIDELTDLMMVASREVELYVARLAQMARAAGIHLMVATQRPSTDVVTGVIKANFPARISFQLRSKPDSMTILGTPGAEALLGKGDMLILPPTSANLARVHGAYVSEAEITRVVNFLKAQAKPVYDESILRPREDEDAVAEAEQFSDELYEEALRMVAEMRQVSISVLQRRLRIGYQRSARMIERMEREGLVGSADGAKPREVLMRPAGALMDGAES